MDGTRTGRGSGPMVKALTGGQALGYEEKERHDDQVRNISKWVGQMLKKKRVMISKKFCLDISEDLKCVENEKKKLNKKKKEESKRHV